MEHSGVWEERQRSEMQRERRVGMEHPGFWQERQMSEMQREHERFLREGVRNGRQLEERERECEETVYSIRARAFNRYNVFMFFFNFHFDLLAFNRYEDEREIQAQAALMRRRRLREMDVQDLENIAEARRRSRRDY